MTATATTSFVPISSMADLVGRFSTIFGRDRKEIKKLAAQGLWGAVIGRVEALRPTP